MKILVCSVLICLASIILWISFRHPLAGYGVYDSTSEQVVLNYQNATMPTFSHGNDRIAERLKYSFEYQGSGVFKSWRNKKACGFESNDIPFFRFVLPRGDEYVEGKVVYKILKPSSPYGLFKNYKNIFVDVGVYTENKLIRKFKYDKRIGIREFYIYNIDGDVTEHGILVDGDGILAECGQFSIKDFL